MAGTIATVAISVVSSSAVSSCIVAAVTMRLDRSKLRWDLRRKACADALTVVDGLFANRPFITAGSPVMNLPQSRPSIADVRRCQNDLLVTCKTTEVAQAFMQCVGVATNRPQSAGDIHAFRQAVRSELGFSDTVNADAAMAWLAYVPETMEGLSASESRDLAPTDQSTTVPPDMPPQQ